MKYDMKEIITPSNGINIDRHLISLGFMELYALAEFFDHKAEECRARASYFESRQASSDSFKRELQYMRDELPRVVAKQLRHGHTLDTAIQKTAEITAIPCDTIEIHWTYFTRAKRRRDRENRNKLIVQLAEYGLSNDAIGKRLRLHPNSVSRIISETAGYGFRRGRHPYLYEAHKERRQASRSLPLFLRSKTIACLETTKNSKFPSREKTLTKA